MPARSGLNQRIRDAMGDGSYTALEMAALLGEPPSVVRARMQDMARYGYLTRDGIGQRTHRYGRAPVTWRKVDDRVQREQRKFEAAKRLVESKGFVLVPRRPL